MRGMVYERRENEAEYARAHLKKRIERKRVRVSENGRIE